MHKFFRLAFFVFLFVLIPSISNAAEPVFPVIDTSLLPPPQGNPPGFSEPQSENLISSEITKLPNGEEIPKGAVNQVKTVVKSESEGIYIGKVVTEKTSYNSGEDVKLKIYLSNSALFDQENIYFDVSLGGGFGTTSPIYSVPRITYDTKSFGPFSISKSETKIIQVTYTLPKSVGGKNLGINVKARFSSGFILGWLNAPIENISGGVEQLKAKQAYIDVDNEKYSIQEGPSIFSTSTAKLYLTVANPSKDNISIKPTIRINERLSDGKEVKKYEDRIEEILPNKEKSFQFSLDVASLKAGVYVAIVELIDGAGYSRLAPIEFKFVIPGDVAVIHTVNFKEKSVNKGDVMNIGVQYSGPPLIINTGKEQDSGGATIYVKVYEGDTQKIIGEGESVADFKLAINESVLPISITKKAETIRVFVSIVKGEKILSMYESSVTLPEPLQTTKENSIYSYWATILILSIVILLVIIALTIYKRKKTNIVLNVIVAAVIFGGGMFYSIKNTDAAGYYNTYFSFFGSGYGAPTPVPYIHNPAKIWWTVGDWIPFTGGVSDTRIMSFPEQTNLWTFLTNASLSPLTSYAYHYNPYTPAYGDIYGTSYYGFSTGFSTAGLPAGGGTLYYLGVQSQVSWGRHFGAFDYISAQTNRVDVSPIYLYDRVAVTCKATNSLGQEISTVTAGTPVIWKMTPSGGTGAYWRYWSDGIVGGKACVPNTSAGTNCQTSWSQTYSTPGTYNAYSAIVDQYTLNNSSTNGTNNPNGYSKCGSGVTVTPVANTSPILSASETPECGGKIEFSWTPYSGTRTVTGYDVYLLGGSENTKLTNPSLASTTREYATTTTPGESKNYSVWANLEPVQNLPDGQSASPVSTSNTISATASTACPPESCSNGLNITTYPSCSCPSGQQFEVSGGNATCACANGATNPPACTDCISPKVIVNGVCQDPGTTCVPPKIPFNNTCIDPPVVVGGGIQGLSAVSSCVEVGNGSNQVVKYNNVLDWGNSPTFAGATHEIFRLESGTYQSIGTGISAPYTDTQNFDKLTTVKYLLKATKNSSVDTKEVEITTPAYDPNDKKCPNEPVPDFTFSASPPLINPGGTCTLKWVIEGAGNPKGNCILSSPWSAVKVLGETGSATSSPIYQDTQYSFKCQNNGSYGTAKKATCKINPNYEEPK